MTIRFSSIVIGLVIVAISWNTMKDLVLLAVGSETIALISTAFGLASFLIFEKTNVDFDAMSDLTSKLETMPVDYLRLYQGSVELL
ncbi:hypothetical protein VYA_43160 (plasmid) [Vibrio alfacsensis]|nr:hypothetical protein VA249_42880 [Vibrio alfacsensis]BCN27124.1 hypothetical protein VYA_43160 [Vibrio alfacsensis]